MPPKVLLVAVDLTGASLRAWEQAARLGAALGVPLEAVHVNRHHPAVVVGEDRVELTSALKRRVALDMRRRLAPTATVHVLEGEPADALVRFAAKRPGAWLVTGTRGRTGFQRLFSTAEAVILRPLIPVLVLKGAPRDVRSIVAPVASDPFSERALTFAAELARRLGATLTPVHVARAAETASASTLASRVRQILPPRLRHVCAKAVLRAGKVEDGLVAAAARRDLIVMRDDGAYTLGEAFRGGTTARVLRASPVPVLVLPSDVRSRGPLGPRRRSGARRQGAGSVGEPISARRA